MTAEYKEREIQKWVDMADRGEIALPSFQRSYVWERQRIDDYLTALFKDRPTGVFLVLATSGEPMFISRTLRGVDVGADSEVSELILDGQQRLTSLWQALRQKSAFEFYVRVRSLSAGDLSVVGVESWSKNSPRVAQLTEAKNAFQQNLVPITLLYESEEGQDERLWEWCEEVCDSRSPDSRRLHSEISKKLGVTLLNKRKLQYCILPPHTKPRVAIDIFVETNKSSAAIKMFDIVVALAKGKHEEELRDRIKEYYDNSPHARHYCDAEEERMIPEVGEWFLKIACLKAVDERCPNGLAPKQSNYQDALEIVFNSGAAEGARRLKSLEKGLDFALEFVARMGASTKRILPAWPVVWVIAALHEQFETIKRPDREGSARSFLASYAWSAFLTDRYEAQANDRLFEDLKGLRQCLGTINHRGDYDPEDLPRIFERSQYPLPTATNLEDPITWIGSRSRIGRALAVVVMSESPSDWVTDEKLDHSNVRSLEQTGKLQRHHIFPKGFLKGYVSNDEINHALNGVLLRESTNRWFSNKDPVDYLQTIVRNRKDLKEALLRKRVETHMVPYDDLISTGSVKSRFRRFIVSRAKLIASKLEQLAGS